MNEKLTKDDAFKNVRAEYMADDAFKNGYPISFPESYKEAPIENCNPNAKKEEQPYYQTYQQPVEEVKPKKKKGWLIILIIIVLLLIGGGAYYYFVIRPKNNTPVVPDNKPNNNTVVDNEPYDINKLSGLRKDDTSNYQNTYTFKYTDNKDEDYYTCDKQCNKSISVKTNNADVEDVMNFKDRFIFYVDGDDYKILDINSNEVYIINLESVVSSYSSIVVCVDELTNHLVGAITKTGELDNSSFFSFKLNKNLYDKQYGYLRYLNDKYMEATIEDCLMDETGETGDCTVKSKVLLSTNSEDVLKQYDYTDDMIENDETVFYYVIYSKNDPDKKLYIEEQVTGGIDSMSTIYNKSLNVVVGLVDSNIFSVSSNGLIYVVTEEDVKAYNETGDVVKTNNSYKAEMVLDDYIVAVKEGNLILATFDGKEVVITGWDIYNNKLDKYYSKTATATKISVDDVAPGKHIIYLEDRENYKAWYYNPETEEVGTTTINYVK